MSQDNITLQSSAAQTATGQSAAKPVKTATMGVLMINTTAVSGTATPTIDYWLECSPDNGTTWFQIPYDRQLTANAAAADLTANQHKRNANGTAGRTAVPGLDLAEYKHIPAGLVRLAWTISGTTPSFSFSAVLAVK